MNTLRPLILMAAAVASCMSLGDGLLARDMLAADNWVPGNEKSQEAFISWDGGLERLQLTIATDAETAKDAVWLVPIPAPPDKVKLDILEQPPRLLGTDVQESALINLDDMASCFTASQILLPCFSPIGCGSRGYGVEVFRKVDKNELTTELLSARTAGGLLLYLKAHGLKMTANSIPVLREYIGKDYSFAATWLHGSSTTDSEGRGIERALDIRFPATKLSFPLRLTSAYGKVRVPATIRIEGFVSPQAYPALEPYLKTSYFVYDKHVDYEIDPTMGPQNIVAIPRFTRVDIDAPSNLYSADLFFKEESPRGLKWDLGVRAGVVGIGVLIHGIASVSAAWLVALVVFRRDRPSPRRVTMWGLANFLTIYGVIAAVCLTETLPTAVDGEGELVILPPSNLIRRRRIAMVLMLAPLAITIYSFTILSLSNAVSLSWFWGLVVTLVTGTGLALVSNVSEYRELRESHSLFTFLRRDGRRRTFVLVFSVTYLAMALAMTQAIYSSVLWSVR